MGSLSESASQALTVPSSEDSVVPNLTIGIGASAGGIAPLKAVIKRLPVNLQASVLIALHRHPDGPSLLPGILRRHGSLEVREIEKGDELECATLYVGRNDESVWLDGAELEKHRSVTHEARITRIDDLFISIAHSAGPNAVGVVLSGMLWDGVEGLKAIAQAGGHCLVQSPAEAQFSSMPVEALNNVPVDFVGDARSIGERLAQIAQQRQCISS